MSPEFWLAIIGISGTLLATIIPQYFTSKKDARDRQQWYAEFALKRRYEALNDLYAKATTCLRQAEEQNLQFRKEPTEVMLELLMGTEPFKMHSASPQPILTAKLPVSPKT